MLLCFLLLLQAIVTCATPRAIPDGHVLHERRGTNSQRGWAKGDRLAGHVQIPVRIGLQQSQKALEKAHGWLMEVSSPSSKNYGQHWTQDKVIEAFKPTEDTVEAVKKWLVNTGLITEDRITHSDNKAWLAFDASIDEMENLLYAELYEHNHEVSRKSMISCDEYHIPSYLVDHIDYITPGVKGIKVSPSDLKKRQSQRVQPRRRFNPIPHYLPQDDTEPLKHCDELTTPVCLQALYGFEPQDPNAEVSPHNSMGIFETSTTYRQDDLNRFYQNYTPYIQRGTKPVFRRIDGAVLPSQTKHTKLDPDNLEADLDFLCAIPIVYPQTTTDFQTDDINGGYYDGIYNTFFDAIDGSYCTYCAYGECGNAKGIDPPYPDHRKTKYAYKGKLQCGVFKSTNVVSTSYDEYEQDLPYYYQRRQCNEALKLGLQGVSLFAASGDTGVNGDDYSTRNGCLRHGKVFDTGQLSTCPYVTAVGATKIKRNSSVFAPEVAAYKSKDEFYSTGGFSNIFTVPDYQKSTLAEYFKNHEPSYPYYYNGDYNNSKGIYNRNGRGVPDVSANGQRIAVYRNGHPGTLDGTSASAPIFASIINRIIEERMKIGKGPVGLVNPVLYEHPEVLNDITEGKNPGCGTSGFSAVRGWDPVTGLGTPNYPKMLELFLSLP